MKECKEIIGFILKEGAEKWAGEGRRD